MLPVQEDHLHIHILSVLVEEVLKEVWNRLVGDVAAHNNMSGWDETVSYIRYKIEKIF